jgi:hypothetical protein
MTKLRYRIWDNKNRKYLDPGTVAAMGDGDIWHLKDDKALPDCSVELSCGFTDLQGIQVYDGDIVRIKGSNWLVSYTEGNARFDLVGFGEMRGQVAHAWHVKEGNVIGDLHHNLELTK